MWKGNGGRGVVYRILIGEQSPEGVAKKGKIAEWGGSCCRRGRGRLVGEGGWYDQLFF